MRNIKRRRKRRRRMQWGRRWRTMGRSRKRSSTARRRNKKRKRKRGRRKNRRATTRKRRRKRGGERGGGRERVGEGGGKGDMNDVWSLWSSLDWTSSDWRLISSDQRCFSWGFFSLEFLIVAAAGDKLMQTQVVFVFVFLMIPAFLSDGQTTVWLRYSNPPKTVIIINLYLFLTAPKKKPHLLPDLPQARPLVANGRQV